MSNLTACEAIDKNIQWAILLPLCGFIFLIGTETFLVSPLLPTIANDFNIDISDAAQIVTAYVLAYAFTAPWFGSISDKLGRQNFILGGGLIFLLGNMFASIADSQGLLVLARTVTGLGAAMAGPAIWAFIGDTVHRSIRGRVMSFGMASFSLGQVLGVPIGTFVAGLWGWRFAFRMIGLIIFILLPVLLLQLQMSSLQQKPTSTKGLRSMLDIWQDKVIILALMTTFFWAAANLGAYTYLGALLKTRYALSVEQLGLTGVIVGVSSLLGALIGGKLADHWRKHARHEELLVGFWAILLGFAVLGVVRAPVLWISMICLALWFLASGAFVTAQQTLLTILAPTFRGTSISWNNSIMYAGTALGVWIIGTLSEQGVSFGWVGFLLGAISATCAILLSYFRHAMGIGAHNE